MRNPLRRRWLVQKYRPFSNNSWVRNMGPAVQESPPAPERREFWRLAAALRERDRLNRTLDLGGVTMERFRVKEL